MIMQIVGSVAKDRFTFCGKQCKFDLAAKETAGTVDMKLTQPARLDRADHPSKDALCESQFFEDDHVRFWISRMKNRSWEDSEGLCWAKIKERRWKEEDQQ